MKTEHFHVHVGSPSLPVVIRELASILDTDDWARHSSEDDKAIYYILGLRAWTADQEGTLKFETMSVPAPQAVSPLRESQVYGQVATERSAAYYVSQAKARLEDCGVDAETISTLMQGFRGSDVNWDSLAGKFAEPRRLRALADLLQALVLEKGLEPDDDSSEFEKTRELHLAVQKIYLRELSQLYDSVVRRAASLEALAFFDPQLNEASRCFLYGFFRATVILSASAVESKLRSALGPSGIDRVDERIRSHRNRGFFNRLVDEADSQNVLGSRTRPSEEPPLVAYSRKVFEERTKVVHKGLVPTKELAEELLTKARQVIEHIHESETAPPGHQA
jgi:hypothetical protein